MANRASVVVGVPAPLDTILRDVIPLFAGNLTCFAADAKRGIGQERGYTHALFLCCAFNISSAAFPSGARPGRMLQISALVSIIRTFGSCEIASRSLVMSPRTIPLYPQ